MNAYEEARLQVLGALLIDYHNPVARLLENADLKAEYNLTVTDSTFEAVIAASSFLLETSYSKDGPAAHLTPSGYGHVLGEILAWIDGTSLEVDWRKEEILTDARKGNKLPGRNGWKIFTYEQERPLEVAPTTTETAPRPIDWTKWGTILAGVGIIITILIAVLS
jgi:hypothetical protein